MIHVKDNKSILCKGDFRPARFYKGKKKIAGYETISFEGEGTISLENCYNDRLHNVKIYGDEEGAGDLVTEGEYSGKYKIGIAKKNSVNLFNKNNPNIVKGTISSDLYIYSNSVGRCVWIEIKPNTAYRVTKLPQSGICALSRVEPKPDSAKLDVRYNVVNDLGGTSADYTVTTGANHKYLVVGIMTSSSNTYTEQEMIDSLYIQVTDDTSDERFDVYIGEPLRDEEYIDFKNGKVVRKDYEEEINLPTLPTTKGTTIYEINTQKNAIICGEYKRMEV